MVVDELITLLGIEEDPAAKGAAKGFEDTLGGIRKVSLAAGTAILAVNAGAFLLAQQFAGTADETGKFAKSVDISVKKLEELEFASGRVGGSASDLRTDLENLSKTYGSADVGINRVIRSFDGMSERQIRFAGQSFGLSESTVRLLSEGADGIAKLRQEFRDLGGGIPDDAPEKAAKFNDEWLNLQTTIGGISGIVKVALLPAFSGATQGLREFLVSNRELISSGLTQFVEGIQKGFDGFGKIVDKVTEQFRPLLDRLGEFTGELDFVDVIATSVTAVLTIFAGLLAPLAIKLALVAAGAAAVAIAVNDIITFLNGGDSAIGRFFDAFEERFPALADLIKFVGNTFQDMFDLVIEGVEANRASHSRRITGRVGVC